LYPVFLALIACESEAPLVQPAVPEVLDLEVSARVGAPGQPAAWTARAAWGPVPGPSHLAPGVCRRPAEHEGTLAGDARAAAVGISGPIDADLVWDGAHGLYTATGPRQALDPAWGVGDLRWTDASGGKHLAEGAVRFGALPEVTRVSRDREGAVTLGWDATTVSDPEVWVRGPAGELVCGASRDGAVLPWWAVPAYGGEVVIRSTHELTGTVDGAAIRARSIIERVVPLDVPAGTTADEKALPPSRPGQALTPRRLQRTPRSPIG
jgi:hypothetical protein